MTEDELYKKLNEDFNKAKSALWEFEENKRKSEFLPLVGTCYKSSNDCGGESWPLYRKLIDYDGRHFIFECFEITDRDDAEYSPRHNGCALDQNEVISNEEYEKAFEEFLAYISSRKKGE